MTTTPKTNAETVAEFAEIAASPAFIKVIGGCAMLRPEATDWLLSKLEAKDREREAAVRETWEKALAVIVELREQIPGIVGDGLVDAQEEIRLAASADGHDLTPEEK